MALDAWVHAYMRACVFSCIQLFVTLWTVAHQALLSMGFPRQVYWSGLPFLPPGNLPDPGIKTTSPVTPALAGRFFTTVPPGKPGCVFLNALGKELWNFLKAEIWPGSYVLYKEGQDSKSSGVTKGVITFLNPTNSALLRGSSTRVPGHPTLFTKSCQAYWELG